MRLKFILLGLMIFAVEASFAQAGLLRKMKERAEDEVVQGVFGDKKKKTAEPSLQQTTSESQPSNNRGGGLTNTPPNVPANIADAGSFFSSGDYRESRYAVRQAILGIEMEIGQNVLDGLPRSVGGLAMSANEDKVESMSIGFVGLTIERVYRQGDQQLKITIGNNAALLSGVTMYMSSAEYASSTDQDHKQVNLKGHPGILEYDEYSGYTLSVPMGQSSIFIAGGINYADENEIMDAAGEFDIEKIKNELGEQ